MGDQHPLLLELASLRQTAARFQHEAHTAAVKLQHHALDASRQHDHVAALQQENARLAHELAVLRANPDVPPHPAEERVQDLSLALRRVSDKIALTETALLERTSDLTETRSELARAKYTADGAYELAARMRAREEASKARERDLEFKARASEEERRMVDLVVQEYADLVRNLEGRNTSSIPNGSASSVTLVDNLQGSKSAFHELLTAFSTESDSLHATITELNAQISNLQLTLNAERATASHDRILLSQVKTELDKLNIEDQTAAKMVARYMKFSQASTNALQQQITTLKARHTSTIATLELQLSIAESQLVSERAHTSRLQYALDELCEDFARESYGRRREVALRLALLMREEGVAEFMRRWVRRARELYARCYNSQQSAPLVSSGDAVQEAFHRVVNDAESLLSSLDDDVQVSDTIRTSGSLARIALSKEAVEALRNELQVEVHKRVEAVRKSASFLPGGTTPDLPYPESSTTHIENGTSDPLLTPNGNANPEHETSSVNVPLSQDPHSSVSVVNDLEKSVDDPFVTSPPSIPETSEKVDPLPSPLVQENELTSVTLLVEEPSAVERNSPVVSMLDLRQDSQPSEETQTTDLVPIPAPSSDAFSSPSLEVNDVQIPQDDTSMPPTSTSTPAPGARKVQPLPYIPPTLLSELGAARRRYDTLQCAFRDCCLALKEIKHTLSTSSPASNSQIKLRQYLETVLSRIDDYAEDARVELEIRVADEELTAHGFETVLSVPGALTDADERAELETNAKAFVDGRDEDVARALEKFGRKLEDVQHDVAAVKRAVHELTMPEVGEDGDAGAGEGAGEGTGAGWTAWTAGLLGGNVTPTRSPTPVQTFGAVMTSPRRHRAASLKEPDQGPLAGLHLRIAVPLPLSSPLPYMHLGLGRAVDGQTARRTLSPIYAVGGLRSASSVGLGVGFGGSSSPARTRGFSGRLESASSPSLGNGVSSGRAELLDLGGVE